MMSMISRLLDIAISLAGLLVTLPVSGAVMLLLFLESPRHIFFSQPRLGLKGEPFNMYKFRKLPVNWTDDGPGVTVAFDARMTKLGAFLERTKIDELPQLWNILKGDMSIVGPRPESMKFKDLFIEEYEGLLQFKPGIFGPNQVKFRNEAELYPPDVPPEEFYRKTLFPLKAKRDLAYFGKSNPFSDLILILKGIWATFCGVINWKRVMNMHIRIIIVDVLMIEAALLVAYFSRYSGFPPAGEWTVFLLGVCLLPPCLIIGMAVCGCYRNPARFFYALDALRLIIVSSLVWLIFYIFLLGVHRALSLYIVPLVWAFLTIFLMFPRVALRFYWQMRPLNYQRKNTCGILIYGAGQIGATLGGIINGRTMPIKLVGFVDDDPNLRGRRVNGHDVLGRESDIPTIHTVHNINEIWLTFKPDNIKRSRLQAFCQKEQIRMTILTEIEPFSRIFGA